MSDFPMPEPLRQLNTREEVLAAVTDDAWDRRPGRDMYRIRSQWIIDIIKELLATDPKAGKKGWVYNADIKALAHERLGLGTLTHADAAKEGDGLSTLVYNAQNYHRSEQLVEQGYKPLTQELLEQAGEGGKIEPLIESLFTIVVRTAEGTQEVENKPDHYTIKRKGGKLYAMKPRSRTRSLKAGWPVKVVKQGKKVPA